MTSNKVLVTTEQRYYQTIDGRIWTSGGLPASFWRRYLAVFDRVRVLARVMPVKEGPDQHWLRADAESIDVCSLPYYIGPFQYLRKHREIVSILDREVDSSTSLIVRGPSPAGGLAASTAKRKGRPYCVEVVGDPYDVFARNAVRHPLRPLLRWTEPRRLRTLVRDADAVSYVTRSVLQRRYPASKHAFTTHFSSIELTSDAFAAEARGANEFSRKRVRIASVGSLEQMYKAPDIVIQAVAQCIESDLDVELVWVGGGKHHKELEELTQKTARPNRFHFTGNLPGPSAVREELDQATLFVLASRTEGLPRAVVEAMARGLPCIGSNVGGIPELLPKECLVPPNDANALAERIQDFCRAPERMEAMSRRNLRKASDYRDDLLSRRRIEFYRHVREISERHLKETR